MPNKSFWPLIVAWNEWIYANLNFKNCWCNVRSRWQFAAEKFLVIVSDVMAFWFHFFILWILCLRQLDLWLREKDRRAEEQWREPTSSDSQFGPFTFQLFSLHSNFPKNSIFLKTEFRISEKNRIRVPFKRRIVAIYFDFSKTKTPRWDLMNLNELNQSKHQVDRALLMQPAFSGSSFKRVSENFIFKSFNPRRGKNLRK